MLRTLLINSTKKQYISLGSEYPTQIGRYLLQLEKIGWDLRHDYIYVMYTRATLGYEDVKDGIQTQWSDLGEIIPEVLAP